MVDAVTVVSWGQPKAMGYGQSTIIAILSFTGEVETTQATALPADALVGSATATITVKEAGVITAKQVAQVRQGENGKVVVIDFGALRNVSSVSLPDGRTLTTIRKWAGSSFTGFYPPAAELAGPTCSFAEVQTERLELTFATNTSAESVQEQYLTMPGAPADLSLEVGGVQAWARPGAVKLLAPPGGGTPVASFTVPIATELQAALARGGANPAVRLRTGTPCDQTLSLNIAYVRVHPVALPPSGIVCAGEIEAEFDAALPLPPESATWQVVQVELNLSGRLPSWRGWPLPDPPENADARLVLDASHSYAARLPAGWLAPLADVLAVRVPVVLPPGFTGAELAAVLYRGDVESPIEPVPAARFVPAQLPSDAAGGARWVELKLAKPVKVPPGAVWWVEIAATRGSVDWPMTDADDDAGPEAIRLRRSLPGPPFRPLAVRARRGVEALVPAGRLRLVGTPRSDDLRPGVVPLIAGTGAPQVAGGVTPSPASGTATLIPAIPATAARGEIAGNALRLKLRLHAAGQVTVNAANVYYRTP